jgi:hypothetical protein
MSALFYAINPDERKLLDSSYIGNIAASNAVWVMKFGTRRKKGNIKKIPSLRNITPITKKDTLLKEDTSKDSDEDDVDM